VLTEVLREESLPRSLREGDSFTKLAAAYKQINAPLGELGMDALTVETISACRERRQAVLLRRRIHLT